MSLLEHVLYLIIHSVYFFPVSLLTKQASTSYVPFAPKTLVSSTAIYLYIYLSISVCRYIYITVGFVQSVHTRCVKKTSKLYLYHRYEQGMKPRFSLKLFLIIQHSPSSELSISQSTLENYFLYDVNLCCLIFLMYKNFLEYCFRNYVFTFWI